MLITDYDLLKVILETFLEECRRKLNGKYRHFQLMFWERSHSYFEQVSQDFISEPIYISFLSLYILFLSLFIFYF